MKRLFLVKMIRLSLIFVSVAGLLFVLLTGNASAGEACFNEYTYKASHNSYERAEALDNQIDDWNVWMLELDLNWDAAASEIWVDHDCNGSNKSKTLRQALQTIAAAQLTYSPIAGRVTVIYLEMKYPANDPCYNDWPVQETYKSALRQRVSQALGDSKVYPASEFHNQDRSVWPTHHELLERGYRYVIILDEKPLHIGGKTVAYDPFFFGVAYEDKQDMTAYPSNYVLINLSAGNDNSPTNRVLNHRGSGRWLYRAYSNGSDCGDMDGAYWTTAVETGYNFVASNCVDREHTFQPPVHSPSPVWVWPEQANKVYSEYGTIRFPFSGFWGAYSRVTAGDTVLVYDTTEVASFPGSFTLSKPMTIKAASGPHGTASLRLAVQP